MRTAALITVGTEILTGSILNTNAQFLCRELSALGYDVEEILSVRDDKHRLKKAVENSFQNYDLTIITGGLGPTMDDLTVESVSEALGRELILDESWLSRIAEFFKARGMVMTDNNIKQAMIPEGATIIDNPVGTACGILIDEGERMIILLPGVPREMKNMFSGLVPLLRERLDRKIDIRRYMLTGIGESIAEDLISDIVREADSSRIITTYANPGEIEIRVSYDTLRDIDDWDEIIRERLGKYIFTERDEKLYETVARYLMENKLTITTAESCTGGLIGEMLTRVPGISSVYKLGLTTYSNVSKRVLLNVSEETLDTYGAVSSETCREMCIGAREILGTDIGVAVTGYAGPDAPGEPAGLVYTGIATEDDVVVAENHFRGTRESIRRYAANRVFQMIRDITFTTF